MVAEPQTLIAAAGLACTVVALGATAITAVVSLHTAAALAQLEARLTRTLSLEYATIGAEREWKEAHERQHDHLFDTLINEFRKGLAR